MKYHEFIRKYANTPIENRFNVLDFNKLGKMSLNDVYDRIKELENMMRPQRIEQDNLLRVIDDLKTFHGVNVFAPKPKK